MRTYKSPYRTKFYWSYRLVFNVGDHIEAILKNSVNITKSRDYDFIEEWLGKGLLISTGDKWHRRRKQLTPAFHFQILKDFVPIFNEQSKVFVDILRNGAAKSGSPVDLCGPLTALTLDIICETAMGKQLHAQTTHSDYADAVFTFSNAAIYRSFRPWLWYKPLFDLSSFGRKSNKALKVLHDFTNQVIHEREQIRSSAAGASVEQVQEKDVFGRKKKRLAFMDLLLDLKEKGAIDLEGVREEVDTFMFEGHDTTAQGLMWAMYCIGAHPDVQKRLNEEIDGMFDVVTSEEVNKLQYLECVLKESQRLFPSVPMVARRITQEFHVDGYRIPEDVNLNISIVGVHRNPKHFPDPLRFDPSRFEPEQAEGRHPFSFIPFSAGPRNCIGQRFALLEEKVVICHALRNFSVEAVDSFDAMRPAMQLVLKPTNGIWLRVRER